LRIEVVTIGTELVLGLTADANGQELGRALAGAGAEVVRRTSVPDAVVAVRTAVADAIERTGFVITTGGLGPTADDVTREAVAGLFGRRLILDPTVLSAIEERFRRFGRVMPPLNRRQAEVPEGGTVLPNPRGTAPGLWLEEEDRTVVMLPGVPSEMRGLLVEEVLPRIAARLGREGAPARTIVSRTLRTTGVPESSIAEQVAGLADAVQPLTIAFLPSPDGVDLRVTAWGLEREDAVARLDRAATLLTERLGTASYGTDDDDLAAVVLAALRRRRWRLALAESCTGGLVGARITAVPGASEVFAGAVVAYGDVVKRDHLGVSEELLARHGAVSPEVAAAMADGVADRFGTESAIAVTGIAGPGGGTLEKPVGTVCLAARAGSARRAVARRLPGDRGEIRHRSAQAALDLLRRLLDEG
jgi:nicotinamide-nucleotide amidase